MYCIRPTKRHRRWRKMSRFRPLQGRLWGVFNAPLQLGTCDPMKYRYNSPTGYVWPFEKLSHFHSLRGRLWGVFNTPLRLGTCNTSKYRCYSPTGYVWPFKKLSCFRPLRGRLVGVFFCALRPGTGDPSKYGCDSPTGYGRSLEIRMRSPNRVRAALRKTVLFSSSSGPLMGRILYASTTGYV